MRKAPEMRDPREWVKFGLVEDVVIDETGVYVDCTTQPEGYPVRAQMQAGFAGNGFGIYHPVNAGDQVLLAFPDGSLDGKVIALGILHNDEDVVPTEARSDPTSFWLVTQSGRDVRIKAAGAGKVILEADRVNAAGASLTVLGDAGTLGAVDGVVTGTAFDWFTGQTQYSLGNASTKVRAKG